jgi:hypothetical protein
LPSVPIATFLAGSLLTLLLPVALLLALVVWYWMFSVRVPETADGAEAATPPPVSDPALTTPDPARTPASKTGPGTGASGTSPPARGA